MARNAIAGIDEEISERRRNVEQLQGEAQRAEELSRLGAEEVEAVQHALREVVSSFDRRSMKVQIIVAAVTSVLSIIGSVLVNIFVP